MDKQAEVSLVQFSNLRDWKPKVGDIIIRHGWFIRTKWFGVVNHIRQNGELNIIKEGSMRLLVTTSPDVMKDRSIDMPLRKIQYNLTGAYAVMQQSNGVAVWYI